MSCIFFDCHVISCLIHIDEIFVVSLVLHATILRYAGYIVVNTFAVFHY